MTEVAVPEIATLARIAAPAPSPQSLSHDGTRLWVGSWETGNVYGLDPLHGTVFEEFPAPGKPVGSTMLGDELRFVLSENGEADDRFIRRYVPGHGFKTLDAIAAPEDTGSFVVFDGTHMWITQRFNKRAIRLDPNGTPARTLDVGEQIMGAVWRADGLHLVLWLGKERGGSHLGFIDPAAAEPKLAIVGRFPFVAVALTHDGTHFWTNDHRASAIVRFEVTAR